MTPFRYDPSPTAHAFIRAILSVSTALRLLILSGPRGEGKTWAAIIGCYVLAETLRTRAAQTLPLIVAVVRDTWANLARTTIPSFEEFRAKGLPVEWKNGQREALIPGRVHFYFFGLDRPEDADRLQGFTCGVLWLEEVAPAAGVAAGVPAESLGLGITSVRQPGVPPRVLITLNPPDEDHWVLKVERHLRDLGLPSVRVHRFEFAPGEKATHFRALAAAASTDVERRAWLSAAGEFDDYRVRGKAALEAIGRGDLIPRLFEGKVGAIQEGAAVVPGFSRLLHVAADRLRPSPFRELYRFWDGGATPSCVWAQATPSGDLNVLGARTGENTGMEQFLTEQVLPFQTQYALHDRGEARVAFRDICDPSMFSEGKTVNAERAVTDVLVELLHATPEPGPVAWAARREALHSAFGRKGRGDRMFVLLDPVECDLLIKALAGRFHYPKDLGSNRIIATIEAAKRCSGIYAQAPDALAYGLAVLHPAATWLRDLHRTPSPKATPWPRERSWMGV